MTRNLAELASWLGGTLVGDGSTQIVGAAPLGLARPGEIILIESHERAQRVGIGDACAAIVPRGLVPKLPAIQVDDIHAAFARVVTHFRPPLEPPPPGISPTALVSPTARIADDVTIMHGAIIGPDVTLGARTIVHPYVTIMSRTVVGEHVTIFPNVVLYENCVIGSRVMIHAGAVIGAYGFGYTQVDGKHKRSAQLGFVEIGDDVEIGACTTIDRGAYGATVIGEGTKIDNHVQVGHNVRVGRHNLICAQVGLAGSSGTGDFVVLAGQVGVTDHVQLADRVRVGAQAGVTRDAKADEHMTGMPAMTHRDQMQSQAVFNRLPEMRQQIRELKAAVAMLERRLGAAPDKAGPDKAAA
ncbi:MAG TPA: UDP-3-O-(3-hydroxymyristoyl)glucosamine N-acyltransferase [Pirellulales bacterium]|jgi:UDP-3-O-[3-hydroxymyristoyl] glucosamine N-acyltransferase|nr:UDP-3-O-(3-hydroxymyristoyl)glucosamine N-acyltransferase [Pirellulales bacterium]